MLWNVPSSIYEGKGGNISLLTTTPTSVFDGYGFGLPDWNNIYHQYISYDSINKKVYMESGSIRLNTHHHGKKPVNEVISQLIAGI